MNAKKIIYYDLRQEALAGRLPHIVGRCDEMERLSRTVARRIASSAMIVAPIGAGKTALVYGWMRQLKKQSEPFALFQLDAEHVTALEDPETEDQISEAFAHLPPCILFIDDFGRHVYRNDALMQRMTRLYKQVLKNNRIHVVLTLEPQHHQWLAQEHAAFLQFFESIELKRQGAAEYKRMVNQVLPRLNNRHVIVPGICIAEVIALAERFPSLGQLPRSAIRLLDESIALASAKREKLLSAETIAEAAAAKTGVPKAHVAKNELEQVRGLEEKLRTRIVHQDAAIRTIATTLQRATLGLRNPNRPLGSFLLLGPSGVGKTETAKATAEILFGDQGSFIRFDMSEFQQDHTVQRLIGAPAGYVGFEEGGALTNALRKNPYSLILLDEIEKAHPKIFDLFLQVLDDGRLSSGQNETIDACNAVIMATSNAAVTEILAAAAAGADTKDPLFLRDKVMPILAQRFRLEFLNRFDSILIFQPLPLPALFEIAGLEIKKVEQRLRKHQVRFDIEPAVLQRKIQKMVDPRFGARPVKRFIEETCETLLVRSLLSK